MNFKRLFLDLNRPAKKAFKIQQQGFLKKQSNFLLSLIYSERNKDFFILNSLVQRSKQCFNWFANWTTSLFLSPSLKTKKMYWCSFRTSIQTTVLFNAFGVIFFLFSILGDNQSFMLQCKVALSWNIGFEFKKSLIF